MPRRTKMVILAIVAVVLLSIVSFILLVRFYPPLRLSLFGGEIPISLEDIQFWVKKVPQRNYYRVYARYLKDSKRTEDPDFGHAIFFEADIKNGTHGSIIVFNPEDNKIYGGGWSGLQGGHLIQKDPKKWKRVFYCLSEGKVEGDIFRPVFLQGTKFTFMLGGSLDISSAPAYYITIYLPYTLKKLTEEELEKGILAEIVEDVTKK